MREFKITTSLIKRLRTTMVTIAIFSILVFFGIYLSSLNQFRGLTSINSANSVFALTTQSIEGLDTSTENLQKLLQVRKIDDIKFAFEESLTIIKSLIDQASKLEYESHHTHALLLSAQSSILLYEQSVFQLFDKIKSMPHDKTSRDIENIKAELLVAQQFAMDAKEYVRKAQIDLKNKTDLLFTNLYSNRFQPLIVATILSIIFFSFVVTFGFSITRRIGRSIGNLTEATDIVSHGDFSYTAKILEPDEIGGLTHAFNVMVHSLKDEKNQRNLTLERISRLQEITAAFSQALTVDQVCEVTVAVGFNAMEANSGTISIMNKSNDLEIKRSIGLPKNLEQSHFSLGDTLPITDTLRYSKPIFIEGQEEIIRLYPHLKDDVKFYNLHAWAFVPLEVASSKIGSLGFYFSSPKNFTKNERDFMIAIGQQCAQAIHRSQLYDEARLAIQAREEFLSIASHELKTPLTSLKLQFQMLSRQLSKGDVISTERLTSLLDSSDKQIHRLTLLIDDLLDVSRISSGKFTLNFGKFNLASMIQDIISQYGQQLKNVVKEVHVTGSSKLECTCDRIRLEQILINLLTNAAKYAPGKPIEVHLEERNGKARICVIDQGPGISPEDQARIFERFERVKDKENVGGLGLGLYISKQLVKAHHGDLWVESELGKGSTFIVEIPLQQIHEFSGNNLSASPAT